MTDTLKPYRMSQLEGGHRPGSDAIFNSHSKDGILSALKEWNSQRILLVHSKALAKNTHVISYLKEALGDRLTNVKEGVGSHSPYSDVIDIAHRITEHKIDCVISVGSGSYSDACKVARLMSATLPAGFREEDMENLLDQDKGVTPQDKMKKADGVKLILVPTSLSAGEWNHTASCTNSAGKKQHFSLQDGGAPDLILMDPWVARTSPEKLWMSSGIRAVDHCVETLCNPECKKYPDVQEWCEEALRDLAKGLVEYKEGLGRGKEGEDELVHGVSKCQTGSRMALMGFIIYRVNMGASHAIGHQLGSVGKVMHGITSCIMLPPVLRYTKARNPGAQARIVEIFNEALGWEETDASDCVARLVEVTGLPSTLRDVGVTNNEQIEQIIDKTMTDVMFSFGKILTRKEVSEIVYSTK
ncbi:aldehyde-alcohol dehydrogenase [Fusarium fujikuroi]|nr:aldehyde-alcohol dehydrogenase [Fusarium fujikuroi]SCO56656.1 related to aldehyde-alcohol dehydrogenase [Fusarium fujikuroi]